MLVLYALRKSVFNEHTGDIVYDRVGSFDGIVIEATRTRTGIVGGALYFDGIDDYVDCGIEKNLVPENLTVNAWIKLDGFANSGSVVHRGGDLIFANLDLAVYGDKVRFQYGNGDDFVSVRSGSVPVREWTMISGTRQKVDEQYEAAVYINGVLSDSETHDFLPAAGDLPLTIGGPAGEVDDVQIFRVALGETDLLELYYTTLEQKESDPNLVSHWSFDEGSGGTALDSIGGYDGQVIGATWTTGIIGGALQFDGEDDLVDCGNLDIFASSDLTVNVWLKIAEFASRRSFIHQGGALFEADLDLLVSSTGQVYFEFGNSDVFDSVSVRSQSRLSHEWHMITARRTEAVAELLIDGSEEDSQTYDFPLQIRDLPLIIGGPKGTIDDVRIYNRMLTTEEVSGLFAPL